MDLKLCYNTFKFKEGDTLIQTFTRYNALMNELVNDDIKLSKLEINTGFINGLPKKWLNSLDDEEDIRSSQEYMNDLEEEFHKRALLAKSKRFFKRVSKGSVVQRHLTKLNATHVVEMVTLQEIQKPKLRPTKDFEAKYNKVKAKLALSNSSALASKSSMVKNKGLVAKAYEWDEEDVSSDDNGMVKVKVFMALVDDESVIVGKESARNSEWVKVSMRKERPWLSKAEGFILPNHETGRILPTESQMKVTDPSVAVTDSLATEYDSPDESSVCSTPLPLLEKLAGVEPVFGPKTIKSILKLNSTFKAETLKASKKNSAPAVKLKNMKTKDDIPLSGCDIRNPIWYLDSGFSRHMTCFKSYWHKYVDQSGLKVVFGDDFTCTTEGYGSIKCNGIVFTKVAFVNGLKYNLISISKLCDAKYIVQFDEKKGIIFNSNKEVVMIAPSVRDVYVLDMTSSAQQSCFFAKASESLNWL
ncbi:hypothetical protein Tco_0506733 [Tanacetum coccineum]